MERILVHHGIKNQKHGVRRFQNYDGSLTPEGRIRYGVGKSKKGIFSKKKTAAKTKNKSSSEKYYKEMSDDELRKVINRLQLEKKYQELTPKQTSAGRRFMKSVMNDVVVPAAKNVGKAYLEKQLKSSLGIIEDKDKDKNKKK